MTTFRELEGRALTMAQLSGAVNDAGLLTIRGIHAIENERRRRNRQDCLSAAVDRLGLAGELVLFLQRQADHRSNDVLSLVRDVLYQWAESRGYRPMDEDESTELA